VTETEALAQLNSACDAIDRDAEDDPNGGFGPGMQAAVREFRAILEQVEPTSPGLVLLAIQAACERDGHYPGREWLQSVRMALGVAE
jgi:hypothetical protein